MARSQLPRLRSWLAFFLLFLATERFCRWQTHGFTPQKIVSLAPPQREDPSEVQKHLQGAREFRFLGSGNQCYAFENGALVLKFLKQNKPKLHESIMLAKTYLPEETALLYTHLAPTPGWDLKVTLVDAIGIRHTVDLSKTEFVIQRKVTPFPVMLTPAQITSFTELTLRQCHKGIAFSDGVIERNFGFLGDQAVLLDIGSFHRPSKLSLKAGYQEEVFLELLPLREHLQTKQPSMVYYLDELVQKAFDF